MAEAVIDLDPREARRLALHAQGLLVPTPWGRGKAAARRVIEDLGYIQIDTISVIERAHHHVLRTRVPNFAPAMLTRLQRHDRDVFEYWFHAAAYLPMASYRHFLPMMTGFGDTRPVDRKLEREILAKIRAEGPVQSKHFDAPPDHAGGGWWQWKPAKQALETMFLSGKLMVSHREGFQKVFDLPERVLPAGLDTRRPSDESWARFFAETMARAQGIGTAMDLTYPAATIQRFLRRRIRPLFISALNELVEDGVLARASVRGEKYYVAMDRLEALPQRLGKRRVTFLSPFDNLVINRRRLAALFDFDYQIECYVPAAKRQYGYFCLPILWGDKIVGRMDARARRKEGVLEIPGLFLEPGFRRDTRFDEALDTALSRFAVDNGCSDVRRN